MTATITVEDAERIKAVRRVVQILRDGAPDRSKESNAPMAGVLLADILREDNR